MNCNNIKCLKDNPIETNRFNCHKCENIILCSQTCLINHDFQIHQSRSSTVSKENNENTPYVKQASYSFKRSKKLNTEPNLIKDYNPNNKHPNYSTYSIPTFGEFLHEITTDPYYDYSNFEYVLDSITRKKKLIGAGTFGEVFLSKNKLDNCLYAVKHVSY